MSLNCLADFFLLVSWCKVCLEIVSPGYAILFDWNTLCLFICEQEDPRLKIPVQQRRRASLDPSDLGVLPVSSSAPKRSVANQLKDIFSVGAHSAAYCIQESKVNLFKH